MRNIYNYLLILFCAVLSSGCLVGPKAKNPGVGESSQYYRAAQKTDSSKITSVKWTDLYNDPVLNEYVKAALSNNLDVQIAVANYEAAAAVFGFTKADTWPQIGYKGEASSTKFGKNDAQENYSIAANASWEIDFWGKYRHANRAARKEMLASELGVQATRNLIASSVMTLYFQLRDFDNRLEISERTLRSREEYYQKVRERFEGGDISELDKLQSEQQLAIAKAAVPNFKRQVAFTEHALNILLGKNPALINRGLPNKSIQQSLEIPVGIPSDILEMRPDVKANYYLWEASVERIGVAQALRFPSISLTAALGFVNPQLENLIKDDALFNSISGSVLGPIFQFNKNKRRVEIQRKRAEVSFLEYKKSYLKALTEVEDALITISTIKEEHEARIQQVEAAKKALSLSEARYNSGYTSYLEVLDSQRSLFDAELNESIVMQQQLVSGVSLYKSLGGVW